MSYQTTGNPIETVENGIPVLEYRQDGTLSLTETTRIEILAIAGGGSGGTFGGGGGGGGGAVYLDREIEAGDYAITVGLGGSDPADGAPGNDGAPSLFATSGGVEIVRAEGGKGGLKGTGGASGGSGGGGLIDSIFTVLGLPGDNATNTSGGGGGAGFSAVGNNGGDGKAFYGFKGGYLFGGGGAGQTSNDASGDAGLDGGGAAETAGADYSGGGGGGSWASSPSASIAGGSGVVLVRVHTSQSGGQTSKVSGIVQVDSSPAQRQVRAFGYDPTVHDIDGSTVTLSKSLGHATSDPTTGEYTIDLLGGYGNQIFVVAFDDYGDDFTPDLAVAVGDRVHPTTPDGHVYECTGAGTLPSEEPTWVVDTETAQLYGTASMIAMPFYRPMVHGPVAPEVTGLVAQFDDHFHNVALLLHMDGALLTTEIIDSSSANQTITVNGGVEITEGPSGFEQAAAFDGTGWLSLATSLLPATDDFTFEARIFRAVSGTRHEILSQSTSSGGAGRTYFNISGSDVLEFFIGNSANLYMVSSTTIPAGEWTSVAITRSGTEFHLFINGNREVSATSSNAIAQPGGTVIGANQATSGREFNGKIDEIRSTTGVARYTANYSPATKPFPNSAPAWTPDNLFTNDEQGAWYDPSDLTTLFQDAAGTTPVAADGDPVGLIQDKSGNGFDVSTTTSSHRPVYRTDGDLHWLEFDGVDDELRYPGQVIYDRQYLIVAGSSNRSADNFGVVLSTGTDGSSNMVLASDTRTQKRILRYEEGVFINRVSSLSANEKEVLTAIQTPLGSITTRKDGAQQGTGTRSSAALGLTDLILGQYGNGVAPGTTNFYGAIILTPTSDIPDSTRDNAEQFMASKTNVTLA